MRTLYGDLLSAVSLHTEELPELENAVTGIARQYGVDREKLELASFFLRGSIRSARKARELAATEGRGSGTWEHLMGRISSPRWLDGTGLELPDLELEAGPWN